MSEVDLAIAALVVLMAVLGFFQGFIVSAFSLAGLVIGGFVATRLSQQFLEDGASSPYAPMIGLFGALALGTLGGSALQDVGVWVRGRIRMPEGVALDRVLGGVLSAFVALGMVWFIAAVLIATPQLRQVRPFVTDSQVVQRLNRAMPPSSALLNVLARYDPFPAFDGPRITIGAPPGDIPKDPQIRAAASSVVRVVGEACGFSITGSGWVAAPETVVTNAHVLAGVRDPEVVTNSGSRVLDAQLVAFDPGNDLAVLRVPGLGARPLQAVDNPASGTAGAVLGFPENGPFISRPARFSDTRSVRADDIYGRGPISRQITSFRGEVRHGNSGGPLVDGDGRVLTTVFASTVGGGIEGGYGVPNGVAAQLVQAASAGVDSGPCIN